MYPESNRRFSSASTCGAGYGFTNYQTLRDYYNGQYPHMSPHGLTGVSSYGLAGKLKAEFFAGGSFATGSLLGASGYYMYNLVTAHTCDGYSCCYGCDASCFTISRKSCIVPLGGHFYRDDVLVDAGFIPADMAPSPLYIRIKHVSGDGFSLQDVCPPVGCTVNSNVASCQASNFSAVTKLYVTVTTLEELDGSKENGTASLAVSTRLSLAAVKVVICTMLCMLQK